MDPSVVIIDRQGAADGPDGTSADAGAVRTALVVDDDPAVLQLLLAVLGDAGFAVAAAPGVAEALHASAAAPRLDLLVCDIQLGDDDGIGLAERLKLRHPRAVGLVISSGTPAAGDLPRIGAIGRFIAKDADFLGALLASVQQVAPPAQDLPPSERGPPQAK